MESAGPHWLLSYLTANPDTSVVIDLEDPRYVPRDYLALMPKFDVSYKLFIREDEECLLDVRT